MKDEGLNTVVAALLYVCTAYLLEGEVLIEEGVEGLTVDLRLKLPLLVRHQVDLKNGYFTIYLF